MNNARCAIVCHTPSVEIQVHCALLELNRSPVLLICIQLLYFYTLSALGLRSIVTNFVLIRIHK